MDNGLPDGAQRLHREISGCKGDDKGHNDTDAIGAECHVTERYILLRDREPDAGDQKQILGKYDEHQIGADLCSNPLEVIHPASYLNVTSPVLSRALTQVWPGFSPSGLPASS